MLRGSAPRWGRLWRAHGRPDPGGSHETPEGGEDRGKAMKAVDRATSDRLPESQKTRPR